MKHEILKKIIPVIKRKIRKKLKFKQKTERKYMEDNVKKIKI